MKTLFSEKVFFFLLALVVISLPWHEHFNGVCTILLMAWILAYHLYYRPAWKDWRERSWLLLHWAWYALFAIGLLWSSNYDEGIFHLEVHMLLVLVPWMWAVSLSLHKKQYHQLMWCFVVSTFFTLPYTLWGVLPFYIKFHELNMWIITQSTPFHHGFMGMYWLTATFMIWYLVYQRRKTAAYALAAGFTVVAFATLLLLNAKAAVVAMLLLPVGAGIIKLLAVKGKRYLLYLSAGVPSFFAISFLLAVSQWDSSTYQYAVDEKINLRSVWDFAGFLTDSFYHRLGQWYCGVEVWTQNWKTFLFGVGTGDATQALNNCYAANGWKWLEGFSTHNEFLEEAVRHGLLGLLLLLAVFLYPMIQSIRRGNYWYALQSMVFFVALMIDCYLSNQKGIVWYMWIGSLWYMLPRET